MSVYYCHVYHDIVKYGVLSGQIILYTSKIKQYTSPYDSAKIKIPECKLKWYSITAVEKVLREETQ